MKLSFGWPKALYALELAISPVPLVCIGAAHLLGGMNAHPLACAVHEAKADLARLATIASEAREGDAHPANDKKCTSIWSTSSPRSNAGRRS